VCIVPKSGVYVISTTIVHENQPGLDFYGVHQGTIVANFLWSILVWDQSTQTVLIQAQEGDEIYVSNIEISNKNIEGEYLFTALKWIVLRNLMHTFLSNKRDAS